MESKKRTFSGLVIFRSRCQQLLGRQRPAKTGPTVTLNQQLQYEPLQTFTVTSKPILMSTHKTLNCKRTTPPSTWLFDMPPVPRPTEVPLQYTPESTELPE
jgi:hypothetical protein